MRSISEVIAHPPALPVARSASLVYDVLASGTAVIQAPPGTGKTTFIPFLVADYLQRQSQSLKVIVTQPRRVAARAAARRIAAMLGEEVGHTVGYTVRGENSVSRHTRIECVTTGVLLARLQRDPELPGVGAVLLDEIHERHVDSDLTLALSLEARETLRDDLLVIAMSATAETGRVSHVMNDAPIVDIPGEIHPCVTSWVSPPRGCEPLGTVSHDGRSGVRPAFLRFVADTAARAAREHAADVLVFLPGVAEVSAVVAHLQACPQKICPLHGSLSPAEQDAVLSSGAEQRIIVSTSLAESSVTVPGVRVVVDSGLSREPRTDYARGIGGLVTVRESQAAAIQRAGRAGREGPGAVYRCFDESTWARMAPSSTPEIASADLTEFALQAACWGAPRGDGLALLDAPPVAAITAAEEVLRSLDAVDESGRITDHGRLLAGFPVHPRLARALLDAAPVVGSRRASEVCALLSEDLHLRDADLARAPHNAQFVQQARRLERLIPACDADQSYSRDEETAIVVGLAYPERLARVRPSSERSGEQRRYLLANGLGAQLPPSSPLRGQEWLSIAQLDRAQGKADALIRAAAPTSLDVACEVGSPLLHDAVHTELRKGILRSRTEHMVGAIMLDASPWHAPDSEAASAWIAKELATGHLSMEWSEGARRLRARLAFLSRTYGPPWPEVDDVALFERIEEWAGPEIGRFAQGKPLAPISAAQLERLFPWPEAAHMSQLAPATVSLPTGGTAPIDYSGDSPTIQIRLQQAFGWDRTPVIGDARVPLTLELLSPARRLLARTDDLESFWNGPYREVRAQMRGRYVKHAWPQDPRQPDR